MTQISRGYHAINQATTQTVEGTRLTERRRGTSINSAYGSATPWRSTGPEDPLARDARSEPRTSSGASSARSSTITSAPWGARGRPRRRSGGRGRPARRIAEISPGRAQPEGRRARGAPPRGGAALPRAGDAPRAGATRGGRRPRGAGRGARRPDGPRAPALVGGAGRRRRAGPHLRPGDRADRAGGAGADRACAASRPSCHARRRPSRRPTPRATPHPAAAPLRERRGRSHRRRAPAPAPRRRSASPSSGSASCSRPAKISSRSRRRAWTSRPAWPRWTKRSSGSGVICGALDRALREGGATLARRGRSRALDRAEPERDPEPHAAGRSSARAATPRPGRPSRAGPPASRSAPAPSGSCPSAASSPRSSAPPWRPPARSGKTSSCASKAAPPSSIGASATAPRAAHAPHPQRRRPRARGRLGARRGGKPAAGTVELRAALSGRDLRIVLRDDGQGIDLDAVRARAKEGIEPAPVDRREAFALLFEPGFTTREAVTSISGRASASTSSASASPRSTAASTSRATPGAARPSPSPCRSTSASSGASSSACATPASWCSPPRWRASCASRPTTWWRWRGALYIREETGLTPLADLDEVLGFARRLGPIRGAEARPCVVIVAGERRAAFRVDALLDEREIVVRRLGARVRRAAFVSGAALLGNSDVAARARRRRSRPPRPTWADGAAPPSRAPAAPPARGRRLDHHAPAHAIDPGDAVRGDRRRRRAGGVGPDHGRLARSISSSSDIEMPAPGRPRLLARVRAMPRPTRLPFVLVTALGSDVERRRALELGANAYVLKSGFDQASLLDTIEQIL